MNTDVVQEILLHLPVQTLLRLRAVSKWWRDVIDSPFFRKLHTHNNNNKNTICLQFDFLRDQYHCKLSIKLLDNGKSFKLPHNLNGIFPNKRCVKFVGPVKGLICIYSAKINVPAIAICNPFLGQLKILPRSPLSHCRAHYLYRCVGIGTDFDGCYKVVELIFCRAQGHNHARVYSGRTDSWRELAVEGVGVLFDHLRITKPLKSSSKIGYFAHWLGTASWENLDHFFVVTFDMRNEVFRATKVFGYFCEIRSEILARDVDGEEDTFDSFVLFNYFSMYESGERLEEMVEIHEQGRSLHWQSKQRKHMVNLEDPLRGKGLWRGSDYVVVKKYDGMTKEVILYDHRARAPEFLGRFELPKRSEITEYIGSFVSVE